MYIRSSRQQHPLLRALGLQCSNFCCGFSAGGNFEITHQISASATPNPIIQLQTLDQINAERKAANDEHMEDQNDGWIFTFYFRAGNAHQRLFIF